MTEEQRIDRRIKSIGRSLSPTVHIGRDAIRNRQKELDEMSRQSLSNINAKYSRPNSNPIKLVVDGQLRTHT